MPDKLEESASFLESDPRGKAYARRSPREKPVARGAEGETVAGVAISGEGGEVETGGAAGTTTSGAGAGAGGAGEGVVGCDGSWACARAAHAIAHDKQAETRGPRMWRTPYTRHGRSASGPSDLPMLWQASHEVRPRCRSSPGQPAAWSGS